MNAGFHHSRAVKTRWFCLCTLMAVSLSLVSVGDVGRPPEQGANQEEDVVSEKRLIVGFRQGTGRDAKDALHDEIGSRLIREFVSISADLVVVTSRLTAAEAIVRYEENESVRYAERDKKIRVPTDPSEE